MCSGVADDFRPAPGCAGETVAVEEPVRVGATLTGRVPLSGIFGIQPILQVDSLPNGTTCTVDHFGVTALGTSWIGHSVGPQAVLGGLGELPVADECIASIG